MLILTIVFGALSFAYLVFVLVKPEKF